MSLISGFLNEKLHDISVLLKFEFVFSFLRVIHFYEDMFNVLQ